MIYKYLSLIVLLTIIQLTQLSAQIVLNEASNKNANQLSDEDNEYEDWIEIYNNSTVSQNLKGYFLSDDTLNLTKWALPAVNLKTKEFRVIFASGKDRKGSPVSWQSAVLPNHLFDYIEPNESIKPNWYEPGFDVKGWKKGKAGFGFSDNDDSTITSNLSLAVYIRKTFHVADTSKLLAAALYVDYDDGFAAYLNGKEVARMNMDGTPTWNSVANANHEGLMYQGGMPEKFNLDMTALKKILKPGDNVFAIEVHNNSASSSDLSLIPYLLFGVEEGTYYFDPVPVFINSAVSSNMHTNFKISSEGEKIFLYNQADNNVDMLRVKGFYAGWSIGKKKDGSSETGIFIKPTPGSTNNTSTSYSTDSEPEPSFSMDGGFYNSVIKITISSTSQTSEIRYTTNGSDPDLNSQLYAGNPVEIGKTTVLRAICISKTDNLPGKINTNTYFIKSSHSIPVISLCTNQSNLFGPAGIFDKWEQDWERPCYVEYFDDKQQKGFKQFSGIQVDGGAGGSRSQPQHSFRLELSDGVFGDGALDYPLIPDRPNRKHFESIYLRNGSNQYLILPCKDAVETKILSNSTFNYYSAYTPVVVYINGEYWGVYELREKLNDDFFKTNYKAKTDSAFDLLSVSYWYQSKLRAINGSIDHFLDDHKRFLSISPDDEDYLEDVNEFLDVQYYTDYIIAQSWICDTDWPYNNIKIVRGDFTHNRWRFLIQDVEWALNPNGWTNATFDHIAYMNNYDLNNLYLRFWREMMKNTGYKQYFINRFADLMNTSYLFDSIALTEQKIFDSSYPEMKKHFERWGGGVSQAETYMRNYDNNHQTLRSQLSIRSSYVRQHLINYYNLSNEVNISLNVNPPEAGKITISTVTPGQYPWNGIYFNGNPIKIEAKANEGYIFDSWNKNSALNDLSNPIFEDKLNSDGIVFTANFRNKNTGIQQKNQNAFNNKIRIYPNPAKDWIELTINSKDDQNEIFIKMIDLLGNELITNKLQQKVNNNYSCRIPITQLLPGLYIISIKSASGEQKLKFIKIM